MFFFLKSGCFSGEKKLRQGCTTQKSELGMHQNPHFHQISLKINKNPKINPPSTITIPESAIRNLGLGVPYFSEINDLIGMLDLGLATPSGFRTLGNSTAVVLNLDFPRSGILFEFYRLRNSDG